MKLREMTHNVVRKIDGKVIAASIVLTQSCPILVGAINTSTLSNPGTSEKKILDGVSRLFTTAGQWGGAIWAIGGAFALILSIRNEDTETRNKAILNLVAAVMLFLTGTIIKAFF